MGHGNKLQHNTAGQLAVKQLESFSWLHKKEILILFVLLPAVITALYFYGDIEWQTKPYSGWDLRSYRIMAQSQCIADTGVSRPYCYRWLGPLLAGSMPFDLTLSFRLLTWFLCMAFVALFYLFLRSQKYSTTTALAVTLIVMLNKYLFGMMVWNYFQIADFMTLSMVIGMFWALESRSWICFAILLAIGAATKEINMVMIPVAAVVVLLNATKRNILGFALAILPAILIFVTIRVLSNPSGGPTLIEAVRMHSHKLTNPEKLSKMFVNIWVPISFFPLIFFRETLTFLKKRPHCFLFVILIYFASLFGSSVERLLTSAGIVIYWLLADILKNKAYNKKLLFLTILCAFLSCWHHEIGRFNVASQKYTILLSCLALAVLSAAAVCYHIKDRFGVKRNF